MEMVEVGCLYLPRNTAFDVFIINAFLRLEPSIVFLGTPCISGSRAPMKNQRQPLDSETPHFTTKLLSDSPYLDYSRF